MGHFEYEGKYKSTIFTLVHNGLQSKVKISYKFCFFPNLPDKSSGTTSEFSI